MKLAVIGSRTFQDYPFLKRVLDWEPKYTELVSGGAYGADSWAGYYASQHHVLITVFRPDWITFGLSAGFIRNKQIIEACDEVYAFWDGKSKGTKHSIELAKKAGKPVSLYWEEIL